MGNLGGFDLFKQAQSLQKKLAKVRESLKDKVVAGQAGGSMVTVQMNGLMDCVAVKLDKEVVDPDDISMLEDLIQVAVNNAIKKANEMKKVENEKATGMPMPDIF